MGDKVFINGRAAVHAGSIGKSIAFPDVCLCPPSPPAGPVPTPLVNTAKAADLDGCATTVTIEGNRVAHAQSFVARSTGDEVARSTGGGIITHTTQGKAYFQTYSRDVMIEGQPAVRHLDLLTHNHLARMPGNTPPAPWMSKLLPGPGIPPKDSQTDANDGKDWISFSLGDPEGGPIRGARYRLTTPKGRVLVGRTPASGKVKIGRVAKGKCQLEWLDDVAEVAKGEKAAGKSALSGKPAKDEIPTGALHPYTLKLEKFKIRVLGSSGMPCKEVTCRAQVRPFGGSRVKTDGKGWLTVWCPPEATYVDLRIIIPYEGERRRVYRRALPGDENAGKQHRMCNLGFFGSHDKKDDERMFRRAYGVEESETDVGKTLEDVEANYKTADDPTAKRVEPLEKQQDDLSDPGERT